MPYAGKHTHSNDMRRIRVRSRSTQHCALCTVHTVPSIPMNRQRYTDTTIQRIHSLWMTTTATTITNQVKELGELATAAIWNFNIFCPIYQLVTNLCWYPLLFSHTLEMALSAFFLFAFTSLNWWIRISLQNVREAQWKLIENTQTSCKSELKRLKIHFALEIHKFWL